MLTHTHTAGEWWRRDAPDAASQTLDTPEGAAQAAPVGGRLAFASLIAFTVILLTAPQERMPVLAALRIAMLAAGLAFVSYWVDRISAGRPTPAYAREVRLSFLLLGWAIVTVPFSIWPGGSISLLLEIYLKAFLVFWLLGVTLLTVDRIKLMAWTMSLAAIPIAATAVLNYAGGVVDEGRVVGYRSGIAENPNDLALTLNIILPLSVAAALTARSMMGRLIAAAVVLVNIAGVIVTFSRGGFVTLLVVLLLVTITFFRRQALLASAALVVLIGAALPFLPEGYLDRLSTITAVESDSTGSAQERWRDTVAAAEYAVHHPIIGAGIGQDILALNEVRGTTWLPVHNVYLQYAVDLGWLGAGLFIAVMVTATRRAGRVARDGWSDADPSRRELSRYAAAVRVSLLGFAVAGLFHPVAYYFYFYYLAGLSVAVQRAARGNA
jgi:probable O-glycosylation ligase (exosortase A-associated)